MKRKANIQLAKNHFFRSFSRWQDLTMSACSSPIISVQTTTMTSNTRPITLERRPRRSSKCSFENFISIICSSTGKFVNDWTRRMISFCSFRELLRRNYNSRRYWIDIELRHLSDYDDNLCDSLKKQPAELLPLVRHERAIRFSTELFSCCLVRRGSKGRRRRDHSSTARGRHGDARYTDHADERRPSPSSTAFKGSCLSSRVLCVSFNGESF